jgi:hypothetical protein
LRVEQSYGVVRRITILHTQDTTGGDLNNTSSEGSWHRHTRGCLAALAAGNAAHSSRRASPRPSARAQAARRRHGASARPRGAVCSCGCAASPTPPRLPTNHTHTHTHTQIAEQRGRRRTALARGCGHQPGAPDAIQRKPAGAPGNKLRNSQHTYNYSHGGR